MSNRCDCEPAGNPTDGIRFRRASHQIALDRPLVHAFEDNLVAVQRAYRLIDEKGLRVRAELECSINRAVPVAAFEATRVLAFPGAAAVVALLDPEFLPEAVATRDGSPCIADCVGRGCRILTEFVPAVRIRAGLLELSE